MRGILEEKESYITWCGVHASSREKPLGIAVTRASREPGLPKRPYVAMGMHPSKHRVNILVKAVLYQKEIHSRIRDIAMHSVAVYSDHTSRLRYLATSGCI
jgi:hypothetical protein